MATNLGVDVRGKWGWTVWYDCAQGCGGWYATEGEAITAAASVIHTTAESEPCTSEAQATELQEEDKHA